MSVCAHVPDIQATPQDTAMSWRSNFAWALSGNVVYAACQWGMVIALAKLGNSFMVGQFSLGLALAAPVMMFTNLSFEPWKPPTRDDSTVSGSIWDFAW